MKHITDVGAYSGHFGCLSDMSIRCIDWIMSIVMPDIDPDEYDEFIDRLYADLECKITGSL